MRNLHKELLGVFYLVDDKGVIHIPNLDPGGIAGGVDKQASYQRANGRCHRSTVYLFIILTLECGKGTF